MTVNNNNKTYTYYYRLRPPSIGTQPKDFIKLNPNSIIVNNREYWGSVSYHRELTEKELYQYDLDVI